jgi:hypothetical protein
VCQVIKELAANKIDAVDIRRALETEARETEGSRLRSGHGTALLNELEVTIAIGDTG